MTCSQCGKIGHNKRGCKQRHESTGQTPVASDPTPATTSPPVNDPISVTATSASQTALTVSTFDICYCNMQCVYVSNTPFFLNAECGKRGCKQRHNSTGQTPGASAPTDASTSPPVNVRTVNDPSSQNALTVSTWSYFIVTSSVCGK